MDSPMARKGSLASRDSIRLRDGAPDPKQLSQVATNRLPLSAST
jgi:hypothetical protein